MSWSKVIPEDLGKKVVQIYQLGKGYKSITQTKTFVIHSMTVTSNKMLS